jgi:hypothetical protein
MKRIALAAAVLALAACGEKKEEAAPAAVVAVPATAVLDSAGKADSAKKADSTRKADSVKAIPPAKKP